MSNFIRFKFLTGDCDWQKYGGSFISKKFNNGDWDYWLVMEVSNYGTTENNGREYTEYNVSVYAVSPEAAGKENLADALRQYGNEKELDDYFSTDIGKVEALHTYGTKAQLFSETGNNLQKLMKKAREHSAVICGMFGFFMDSPQNGVGSTGWDLISGNIMAGLDRYREAQKTGEAISYSPVLKIMDKISG